MSDKVKMSVYINRDLHRRLRIAVAQVDGASIQQMVEDAIIAKLDSKDEPATAPASRPMTPKEIRGIKRNFSRIMDGGDDATARCLAFLVQKMGTAPNNELPTT